MDFENFATYREITTQTKAWKQALQIAKETSLPDVSNYDTVVCTGCGSTYYLSIAFASLLQTLTGIQTKAVPGSELLLNQQIVLSKKSNTKPRKALLVAFSRSGTTTETVKACEKFLHDDHGDVIVISNYDQVLSQMATVSIVVPEGQEISIAQTRSFSSMYVAGAMMCAQMANRDDLVLEMFKLPEVGDQLIREYYPFAQRLGENLLLESFNFLGSGLLYGLACEISLKFKEMTLTQSEPFHFLEYRHGPMSMVTENVGIIGFVSQKNYFHEMSVVSDMKALKGNLFTIGDSGTDMEFNSALPEQIRGVLYLPIMQLTAFFRSIKKGLNPDNPKHLSAVVKLDLEKHLTTTGKN